MRKWMAGLLLQVGVLASASAQVPESGTLVVDIKPYAPANMMPRSVAKQLQDGALGWGVQDNRLVVSLVNRQFLDFPLDHMTAYGEQEAVTLPAGEYMVTGVGLRMVTSEKAETMLRRGAFVNEDVMTFRIEPGKTTTLSINPMIQLDSTLAVNFWLPTLVARVSNEHGEGAETALNQRGPDSIAWQQYQGPLKPASP
jgi:hypothetical protein